AAGALDRRRGDAVSSAPVLVELVTRPKGPEPGSVARELLGDKAAAIASALAEAVIPPGSLFEPGGPKTADRLARLVSSFGERGAPSFAHLLGSLDAIARVRTGKSFTALDRQRRADLVWSLHGRGRVGRALFMALTYPLKNAHFDDADQYRALGCVWENPPANEPAPRWMAQVMRAS